jgi:RNA polymerase sigma-70 factor, ECF subfamily
MTHSPDQTAALDSLIEQIATGNRKALAQLFESEAGRLVAIARRIVRRTELAEEVVQEVFVGIWQGAARFDRTKGNARGWMTTMVRNRALNVVRDGARMDFHDGETLAAISDREADTNTAFERLPERHALKVCLERLDVQKRHSILLCYVTGLSHGEVAARLDAPLGTIKAWIRRGMSALQECMG